MSDVLKIDPGSFAGAVAQAAIVRFQKAREEDPFGPDQPDRETPEGYARLNGWMTRLDFEIEHVDSANERIAYTLDQMAKYVCGRGVISGEVLFNKCVELKLVGMDVDVIDFEWQDVRPEYKSMFSLYATVCHQTYLAITIEQMLAEEETAAALSTLLPKRVVPESDLITEREGSVFERDPAMVLRKLPDAEAGQQGEQRSGTMSVGETVPKPPVNRGGRPPKAGSRKPRARKPRVRKATGGK